MINTFYSDKSNGCMSAKREFYSDSKDISDIISELKERRIKLGELKGFDGSKIIVPEPTEKIPFTYRDVTEEIQSLISDYPNFDLWDIDIPCDIMLIRSNLKGVVLSYPVADCPVVVVNSKDTLGIAHCSGKMIDKELPKALVDAVRKVSDAKASELTGYIGPCAGYDYVYETFPYWATNDDWKYFISDEYEGYRIDLRKAVMSQLMRSGVNHVLTSTIDTISDPNFYSNYAFKHGDKSKNGRFLTGAYFAKSKTR